jgi:hypothetical protein
MPFSIRRLPPRKPGSFSGASRIRPIAPRPEAKSGSVAGSGAAAGVRNRKLNAVAAPTRAPDRERVVKYSFDCRNFNFESEPPGKPHPGTHVGHPLPDLASGGGVINRRTASNDHDA